MRPIVENDEHYFVYYLNNNACKEVDSEEFLNNCISDYFYKRETIVKNDQIKQYVFVEC